MLIDGLARDRIQELLMHLEQTYPLCVAYFGAGCYRYEDLALQIDVFHDLVSTE